jgi:hypothetical protein
MFLLNLSPIEFLALLGAVSGFVVALYLLSRSRKRLRVATLQFWVEARAPVEPKQRRKIQQPLSLILQLISLALLLLAIAQLRLGSPDTTSRDHVMVLDTSSWMAARSGESSFLNEAKRQARAYLEALPSTDRVMLVRADGIPSPVTGMESNRSVLETAINESRPAAAALNLQQALSFAKEIHRLHARRPGEIVFIGGSRVAENGAPLDDTPNLRIIPVARNAENCGFTRIGLRRSSADPDVWQVFLSLRNYGKNSRRVPLILQFGGATVASDVVRLPAGGVEERTFAFRTRAAGWVEARLLGEDAIREDDRAILEIPRLRLLNVAAYTDDPDLLRPALAAHPQIHTTFRRPSEYEPQADADILILDRFIPRAAPKAPAIWIEPPERGSPFRIRTRVANARVVRWRSDHDLGAGLRSKELRLPSAQVYATGTGDTTVAETEAGPVILARPKQRSVVLGFHPGGAEISSDLAMPLVMANIFRWLEPQVFRSWELVGRSVGTVSVDLQSDFEPSSVRVVDERKTELPFSVHGRTLRFFSGSPGNVRVLAGGTEQVHSLSLPEIGDRMWEPPQSARTGLPGAFDRVFSRDIWHILALLGGIGLAAEYLLFGRRRSGLRPAPAPAESPVEFRKAS